MNKIIWSLFLLSVQIPLNAQQYSWEESIFVHVSKSIAITDEPIWLHVDVQSSAQTFTPSMAYIELVNRSGQSVHQMLLPLENGKGSNVIKAPSNLISDHYILRCYTRSSPHTGENGIFSQLITIINPDKPAPMVKNSSNLDEFVMSHAQPANLIFNKTISKENASTLQIPESGIVSISIANPFLDEKYQGRLSNKIYKTLNSTKILPEPYGHVVHARLRGGNNGQAYYLSAHGRQNYFNIATPNADGEMFFELASFREVNFLLAQKADKSSSMDFELVSPFLALQFVDDLNLPALELKREDETYLNNLILAGRIEEYYYRPEPSGSGLINTEIKPDKTYRLDDYNRFESVEITLKEYIPEVFVRRSNKSVLFKVLNSPAGVLFSENPLLLIDNMPIINVDAFAAFDPKGIEKIDLINRVFYFNDQVYAGVISLTSKLGDFGGFELPKEALYLDYYKFASKVKLKNTSVNPNRENENFPDFRNLLYWNDQAQSGSDMIFPSKLTGTYLVTHSFYDGKNWNIQKDLVEIED